MVLSSMCCTSKWVEAKPIHSNNSKEAAEFLFDEIIARYGCPLVV